MIISNWAFWSHVGCILEAWENFWTILGSCWAQKSSWKLHGRSIRLRTRSRQFDFAHFGGFLRSFGEVFGDIFQSFLNTDFAIGFHLLLKWFFIDFHALQTNKNEQIQWEVLQKLNFRFVSYPMCLRIGFGNIFLFFLDIHFAISFHLLLRWFFIDFHALQTSKNEQIQWEVLQKSNFRLVSYRMCLGIDFGRILESGWRHFWVPIGLQKRLRKQVL